MRANRTSHSQMALAESCPLAWSFKYRDRKDEEPSRELDRGGAAHELIAAYLKHLRDSGLRSDFSWAEDVFHEGSPRLKRFSALAPEDFVDTREVVRLFIDGWIDPVDRSAKIEEWVEATFEVDGTPIVVVGIIDRLAYEDDRWTITDWKTGWASLSKSEMRTDPQTRLYAMLAYQTGSVPPGEAIRIRQVFPRLRMKSVETEIDHGEIGDLLAEVNHRVRNWRAVVADPEPAARPSYACGFCSFKRDCPAIRDGAFGYTDGALIATPEDAEKAAREVLALDARRRDRMKALRAWVEERGPVAVEDRELAFHLSESETVENIGELLKRVKEIPVSVDGFLRADARALSRVRREIPVFDQWLRENELLISKTATRFDFRKAGGDADE